MPERLYVRLRELFATAHPNCVLVSCFADGTDLIAAQAWPRSHRLEGLLPVPISRWRPILAESMATAVLDEVLARAHVTVLTDGQDPNYVQLADRLVDRVDRLLAVWDGEAGRAGGTGSVVRAASAQGKPVLHIPLRSLADEAAEAADSHQ